MFFWFSYIYKNEGLIKVVILHKPLIFLETQNIAWKDQGQQITNLMMCVVFITEISVGVRLSIVQAGVYIRRWFLQQITHLLIAK